jgi:hypothetical protein
MSRVVWALCEKVEEDNQAVIEHFSKKMPVSRVILIPSGTSE